MHKDSWAFSLSSELIIKGYRGLVWSCYFICVCERERHNRESSVFTDGLLKLNVRLVATIFCLEKVLCLDDSSLAK